MKDETETAKDVPEVVQLRILMEQDFGDLEGKKWSDMQAELQNKAGFVAVETKDAMGQRADIFLDEHLLPLLDEAVDVPHLTVAVVSHGIFLSTLWKRLLRRLPARSISLSSELQSTARPSLEHLGGWSNTGYLELLMTRQMEKGISSTIDVAPSHTSKLNMSQFGKAKPNGTIGVIEMPQTAIHDVPSSIDASAASVNIGDASASNKTVAAAPSTPTASPTPGLRMASEWTTTVTKINGKDHLKGLKRTGGGVGSSRHDASQKGIDSFFKRRRVE